MLPPLSAFLFASVVFASPILNGRKVDALNEEATKEAHQRDDTATRAFSSIDIKVDSTIFCIERDKTNSVDF